MKISVALVGGLLSLGALAADSIANKKKHESKHRKNEHHADSSSSENCDKACVQAVIEPWIYESAEEGFRHAMAAYNSTSRCLGTEECQTSLRLYIDEVTLTALADGVHDYEELAAENGNCDAKCLVAVLDKSTSHAAASGMILGTKHFRGVDHARDRWISGPQHVLSTLIAMLSQRDTLFNTIQFRMVASDYDCVDSGCTSHEPYIEVGKFSRSPASTSQIESPKPSKNPSKTAAFDDAVKFGEHDAGNDAIEAAEKSGNGKTGFWDKIKNLFRKLKKGEKIQEPASLARYEFSEESRAMYDHALRETKAANVVAGGKGGWLNYLKYKLDLAPLPGEGNTSWDEFIRNGNHNDNALTHFDDEADLADTIKLENALSYPWAKDHYESIWQWVANSDTEVPEEEGQPRQPWQGAPFTDIPGETNGKPAEIIQGYQMEFDFDYQGIGVDPNNGKSDLPFQDWNDGNGDYRIWPKKRFDRGTGDPVRPECVLTLRGSDEYPGDPDYEDTILARAVLLDGSYSQRYLRYIRHHDADSIEFAILDWEKKPIRDSKGPKTVTIKDRSCEPEMIYTRPEWYAEAGVSPEQWGPPELQNELMPDPLPPRLAHLTRTQSLLATATQSGTSHSETQTSKSHTTESSSTDIHNTDDLLPTPVLPVATPPVVPPPVVPPPVVPPPAVPPPVAPPPVIPPGFPPIFGDNKDSSSSSSTPTARSATATPSLKSSETTASPYVGLLPSTSSNSLTATPTFSNVFPAILSGDSSTAHSTFATSYTRPIYASLEGDGDLVVVTATATSTASGFYPAVFPSHSYLQLSSFLNSYTKPSYARSEDEGAAVVVTAAATSIASSGTSTVSSGAMTTSMLGKGQGFGDFFRGVGKTATQLGMSAGKEAKKGGEKLGKAVGLEEESGSAV